MTSVARNLGTMTQCVKESAWLTSALQTRKKCTA